ncbi:hypothetical protein [Streptomyces sp. NPDC059009]|uniref:hypothetical protein n=1 Tax=Streptomyces sp. NPDC059009 TaxID=3346694 RepID=UPI00368A9E0C
MSQQPPAHNEFNGTIEGNLVQANTIGSSHAPSEPANPPGAQADEAQAAGEPSVRNIANGHFRGDVIQADTIHGLNLSSPPGNARPAAEEPQDTADEPRFRRYLRKLRRNHG